MRLTLFLITLEILKVLSAHWKIPDTDNISDTMVKGYLVLMMILLGLDILDAIK